MFANGLFDHPTSRSDIDYPAHAEVARQEANEAIVLLRNRDAMLSLPATLSRILVVGGRADLGTLSGGGSSQVVPPHVNPRAIIPLGGEGEMAAWKNMAFQSSPPLAAIRARAPQATVAFDEGRYISAAVARAKQSDVVIVFANQWTAEGEDVPDLSLPSGQDELIKALVAVNPHTVVVLQTGGPVQMPWLEQTAAVLEAWYPGVRGADAIADVLFGQVNPSGRLPITFPASIGQLPGFGLPAQQSFDAPHPRGAAIGYRDTEAKSTLIQFKDGAPTQVEGQFTLHGVTKPLTLTINQFSASSIR
jgi:beta-glucosidase